MIDTAATSLVDRLVAAYNARDADTFADLFAKDAVAFEFPDEPAQIGREQIRAHYREAFARHPHGKTEVRYRVELGPKIVDHELVDRGDGAAPFDCVAVYIIEQDEIVRLDLVREASRR